MTEASQSPTPVAREDVGVGAGANREYGINPNPFASSQSHPVLGKRAMEIERHLLAQHVIKSPRQFMRDGLQGHQRMCPRLFALIEAPNHRLVTNGKVRGFDERPAQIAIAVLCVAGPFAFAVADVFAADTPAVGGEVANRRKSSDVTGFQENRTGQDGPDAGDGLQQHIAWLGP